jgi:hypothetical protein
MINHCSTVGFMSEFQFTSHDDQWSDVETNTRCLQFKHRNNPPQPFHLPTSPFQFMAPLTEEAVDAPATTAAPVAPALPQTDITKEVKKPSAWKLFATVVT